MNSDVPGSILDFEARSLSGDPIRFADLAGRVVLIVNTASECGFTPQYAGLQALHEAYAERGLVVIGFPCNQFGGQEPGDASQIAGFCQRNFGVSFLMGEKLEVNGEGAHPLFAFLTSALPGILGSHAIKWNFTKFLIDRDGKVIGRYAPTVKPEALDKVIQRKL